RGCLRDIGSELRAQLCRVVGEERGLAAGAGDGNVGEAGVEQVWVDAGIGVNEDAFGGEALGAMTGDGIAVVEMTMLAGVEFDLAVIVEACRDPTIGMDLLNGGEVAIGNAERFVGRGELNAVAYGQLAFDLSIDADACETAGIVGGKFFVRLLDSELVCGWVDRDDRCVGGSFDPDGFAATCIANYVVDFVMACPRSFGSGHVLTLSQDAKSMIVRRKASIGLTLLANSDVQLAAGRIVRGDDESLLGRFDVALGDSADALFCVGNFLHPALLLECVERGGH